MSAIEIKGEYIFSRHEMVAGFHFGSDGTFQFFYAYGAVERNATGTFYVEGNWVKLKSDKEPGKDFNVIARSKEGTGYMVSVTNDHSYLLSNLLCTYFVKGEHYAVLSDHNGEVFLDIPHCDKIYLRSNLFPDISTLVKDEGNDHNRFMLTLNPSLAQVSFKDIDLMIANDSSLTCAANYFMPEEGVVFIKQ